MLLFLMMFACTNAPATVDTLEKAGFTDVHAGGYSAFACSDDDTYATNFTATNPQGQKVSGTVCCGVFKNCTIRW